jgi:hypothetical protein
MDHYCGFVRDRRLLDPKLLLPLLYSSSDELLYVFSMMGLAVDRQDHFLV